jgi:hypothetical protein
MADDYAAFSSLVPQGDPYASFSYVVAPSSGQSPLGVPMPTAADLAAKGVGVQPGIAAEIGGAHDLAHAAISGATLGTGDRLMSGAGALMGSGDYASNLADLQNQTQQFQTQHPVVSAGAGMAGMGLAGAALPLATPATALGRLLVGTGTGAAAGGIQGASQSPDLTNLPNTLERVKEGGELGALGGAAAPVMGSAIGRLITPLPIGLPRATDVAFMRQSGIPLSAGQTTGNKPLHILESVLSEMPGSGGGAQKLAEAQNQAFASALLARTNTVGDRTDPATMDAAFNTIGDVFRRQSAKSTMSIDPRLMQEADDALATYHDTVGPANTAPRPTNLVDALRGAQTMPGESYQAQRSLLSNDAKTMQMSDPKQAQFYRDLRDAMDNAMSRSIPPQDAAEWAQARQNWGDLKDIGKAAAGAGENTAAGLVSPAKMRSVIASGNDRIAYARGQGTFADLVRAGNSVMMPFPNSGTAGRINAMHVIGMLGGGTGGLVAGGLPGMGAMVGALGAPAVASRVLMSRPAQSYLGNQLLPAGLTVPTIGSAMAGALAARQGQQ